MPRLTLLHPSPPLQGHSLQNAPSITLRRDAGLQSGTNGGNVRGARVALAKMVASFPGKSSGMSTIPHLRGARSSVSIREEVVLVGPGPTADGDGAPEDAPEDAPEGDAPPRLTKRASTYSLNSVNLDMRVFD